MDFYNLISYNNNILLPEIFFITSIIGLIFFSGLIFSNHHILTCYTNKISFCLVIIAFILTLNTYLLNYNYVFFNYEFNTVIKCIIIISVIFCFIISENSILQTFEFSFLVLLSLLGFILLIMSYDLIMLYIAIEIQSISFYILSCLKRNSAFSTEAGLKYFILGALASGLFLFGCSLIYGLTGTTNFKELSFLFIELKEEPLLILGSLCILSAILFKLSAAPFHIWSPDVYEGAPSTVTAFFSIAPKLSLFIILSRFFNEILYEFNYISNWWIFFGIGCSLYSIWIGSITALQQTRLKRLLAYSAIGHVGYMLLGFFSGNSEGMQAVFFYLILYIITNICIWSSILGITKLKFISQLKLVYTYNPFLCLSLLISFFSLAGVPPLAGFLAKLSVFIAALESNFYLIVVFSIFLSVISTFYYLRLIKITTFEKLFFWNSSFFPINLTKFISISISISFISLFLFFIFPLPLSLLTYYLTLLCY